MRLVRDPTPFDIILCENLYGDLVSDMCAGMVGGLGVAPGANLGEDCAVFESVHGSAPDIAGKNLANPLALLMSATMMLNHIASSRATTTCAKVATRIKTAYDRALGEGQTTADLGGKLGTREFTQAVHRPAGVTSKARPAALTVLSVQYAPGAEHGRVACLVDVVVDEPYRPDQDLQSDGALSEPGPLPPRDIFMAMREGLARPKRLNPHRPTANPRACPSAAAAC